MTSEPRKEDCIEIGIKRGLADIEAGRFNDFTPSCAEDLVAKFKRRLKTEQSFKGGF